MQSSCPNPGCGAAYNLGPQHLGRRLTCRQCASALVVTGDGLQFADAVSMPIPTSPLPQPTSYITAHSETGLTATQPSVPRSARPSALDQLKTQFFTALFAAGTFLIIVFLFLPLIDAASAVRQSAKIETGEFRITRAEADLTERKVSRTSDDWKHLDEDRKAWDKEKVGLKLDAEEAKIDVRKSHYWHLWGMMLGFLMLSAASIGYLSPNEGKVRRVVGAIVICSLLLLVFIAFVIQSSVAH
jgi:hypothetical protein